MKEFQESLIQAIVSSETINGILELLPTIGLDRIKIFLPSWSSRLDRIHFSIDDSHAKSLAIGALRRKLEINLNLSEEQLDVYTEQQLNYNQDFVQEYVHYIPENTFQIQNLLQRQLKALREENKAIEIRKREAISAQAAVSTYHQNGMLPQESPSHNNILMEQKTAAIADCVEKLGITPEELLEIAKHLSQGVDKQRILSVACKS